MTDNRLSGRQILLVEDEMIIAMLLEDMLEDLGCRVVATAAGVPQAIAAIQANAIDAAVLDVNLDGQDSYSVAAALAARRVPFIFSTGYGELTLKEEYRKQPILKKPFRIEDLARALSRVLAG